VDNITAELEAEAQRAADAGGYQPGAVTKTQLKSRMKREKKEKIKPEEPWGRLDAAVARREQAAEAKQIATAEKQAAAVKKRVVTIAKKVAISGKT